MTDQRSDLGNLLEAARAAEKISGREAARRSAGVFTEGRWRQVVNNGEIPPARTVVAMALAVRADPGEALEAAGTPTEPEAIREIMADLEARARRGPSGTASAAGLAEEIERVNKLPLPPEQRIRIANALIQMYEEQAREPVE